MWRTLQKVSMADSFPPVPQSDSKTVFIFTQQCRLTRVTTCCDLYSVHFTPRAHSLVAFTPAWCDAVTNKPWKPPALQSGSFQGR